MGRLGDGINILLRRGNVDKKVKELLPAQKELMMWKPTDKSKSVLCWGGTRSGKTVGAMMYIAFIMNSIPGYSVALMATTEGQADLTLGDTLKQTMLDLGIKHRVEARYNHRCIVLENGSTALVAGYQGRGVDNLLMGAPLDCAVIDEARHLKEEQYAKIYSRLSGCCNYHNVQMMILLTNPEGQEDWLYRHFIEEQKAKNILFPPKDNEKNLPKGYFEAMRNELPEFMQKRLIDSVWCSAEGSVFRDMNKEEMFIDRLDQKQSICMHQGGGVDFGFNHFFAFVYFELHQTMKDDAYIVIKDTYLTKKTILDVYAREVKNILDINASYWRNRVVSVFTDHDPEKQKMLNRLIGSQRVQLKNANKGVKGDVCLFLIRLMKHGKLKMYKTEGNKKLFQQMQIAVWDRSGKNMPMKKEGISDDGLDALTYAFSRLYNNYGFNRLLRLDSIGDTELIDVRINKTYEEDIGVEIPEEARSWEDQDAEQW